MSDTTIIPSPVAAGTPASPAAVPTPAADWRSALPETVRTWEEVSNANDSNQFWDNMTTMRGRMGQSVRVPSNEAGDQDWSEFATKMGELAPGRFATLPNADNPEELQAYYKQIGVPDEAHGYADPTIPTNDAGNPEFDIDPQSLGVFKDISQRHGLTQRQFQGVATEFSAAQQRIRDAAQVPITEGVTQLKGEWGEAYAPRLDKITSVMSQLGFSDNVVEAFKNGQADSNTLRAMFKVTEAISGKSGDIIVPDQGTGAATALTPEEIDLRIDEVMNSPAYNSPDINVRKAAMMRIVKLTESKGPSHREEIVFNTR